MRKKKIASLFLFVLILFVVMFAALHELAYFNRKTNTGGLKVTTSFYPLYFLSSDIVGDKGKVYNITPAGAEPHDYELTTRDRAEIENSDLLILNGVMLEPWGDRIVDALSGTDTEVLKAGQPFATESENGSLDPHVWLDPMLAKQMTVLISGKLASVDGANMLYYQSQAVNLQNKLDALDAKFRVGLRNCKKQEIVTTHAAFGYLAKEYGFKQVPIAGLSPDQEPSVQQVAGLANFVRSKKIKYIFFESLVSPKLAETIASETGAKTMVLNPLEGLTDAESKAGKNYFSEMEQNLLNLKIALECQ